MLELSQTQLRLARLASQRLTRECADDEATPMRVLADVCGVQAQDHPSALMGTCIRRLGLTAEQVERARVEERTIATTWLMRGTLHMVAAEDLLWLVGLLGPIIEARMQWRLRQLGLMPDHVERGVAIIADLLGERGPLPKADIADELVARGVIDDARGQRPIHLIATAAARGLVCIGPMSGVKRAYALVSEWLGVIVDMESEALDREASTVELARRYLEAFGPASARDFAYWGGLPARDAKTAFAALGDELGDVRVDGGPTELRVLPNSRAATCAPTEATGARLRLPSWDNYLMGYADRSFALGPAIPKGISPNGGVLLRALIEDGLVVGKWNPEQDG